MSDQTVKDRIIEVIKGLPDDASVEDVMERLYFIAKVEKGLREAEAGETLSHEEVRREIFG